MTVDFQSLILDTSQIKKDFFAYETDASLIATFEHNDLINDRQTLEPVEHIDLDYLHEHHEKRFQWFLTDPM